jgi:hypothetical protein
MLIKWTLYDILSIELGMKFSQGVSRNAIKLMTSASGR